MENGAKHQRVRGWKQALLVKAGVGGGREVCNQQRTVIEKNEIKDRKSTGIAKTQTQAYTIPYAVIIGHRQWSVVVIKKPID